MNKTGVSNELAKKDADVEGIIGQVMRNPTLVDELISGISSPTARVRFVSAKILRLLSERNPQSLYPSMDFFVDLLNSGNTILKWTALDIVANLTAVDSKNRFDKTLFQKYCGFLHEGNLVTAAHVVDNLGKIAHSKPQFQKEITKQLLNVEEVPLPTKECQNILIGKTISALNDYFSETNDKDNVISFVRQYLKNSRNATKVKAEKFLTKWEKT